MYVRVHAAKFFSEEKCNVTKLHERSKQRINQRNAYDAKRAARRTSSTDGGVQPTPTVNLRSSRDNAKAFAALHARRFRHLRNQANFTRSRKSSGVPTDLKRAQPLKNCAVSTVAARRDPCPAELREGPLLSSSGFFSRTCHHRAQLPSWQFLCGAVVTPWWSPRRTVLLRTVATRRPLSPTGDRRLLALPHPSP